MVLALLGTPAVANDTLTADPRRAVIFASMEAGPVSAFASAGFKLALSGPLDASGFRLMGKLGTGHDRRTDAGQRREILTPDIMGVAGYEWKLGTTYLALYGGLEADARIAARNLAIDRPLRLGPRLQADLWSNPTPQTMIQVSANLGGGHFHVWSRAAAGWNILDQAYLGPEIELYRERHYTKLRYGLHLTGVKILGTQMRISGGWQRAGHRERGVYASLNLHWKR